MTNTNSSPKREKPAIKVLDAPHTPRPPPTQKTSPRRPQSARVHGEGDKVSSSNPGPLTARVQEKRPWCGRRVEGASERLSPTKAPASDFTPIRQMTALTTPRTPRHQRAIEEANAKGAVPFDGGEGDKDGRVSCIDLAMKTIMVEEIFRAKEYPDIALMTHSLGLGSSAQKSPRQSGISTTRDIQNALEQVRNSSCAVFPLQTDQWLKRIFSAKCLDLHVKPSQQRLDRFLYTIQNNSVKSSQSSSFASLNFSVAGLGPLATAAVAAMLLELQDTHKVLSLDLSGNTLADAGCVTIAEMLTRHQSLTHLDLRSNNIGVEGGVALFQALELNSSLTELNLGLVAGGSRNRVGLKVAEQIGHALQHSRSLQYLFLKGNGMGPEGAKEFAEGLQGNTCLKRLDLGLNNLKDEGTMHLAAALERGAQLESLDLSQNQISTRGAMCLEQAMKSGNFFIQSLDLSSNDLNARAATLLGTALSTNSQLKSLLLDNNQLGEEGGKGLAKGLQGAVTLDTLHLRNTALHDCGVEAIASAMHGCKSITKLDLSSNGVGDPGAGAIAALLRHNHALAQLILDDNNVGDIGGLALGHALLSNTALHSLSLKGNSVHDATGSALVQGLMVTSTLTSLDLDGNDISYPIHTSIRKLIGEHARAWALSAVPRLKREIDRLRKGENKLDIREAELVKLVAERKLAQESTVRNKSELVDTVQYMQEGLKELSNSIAEAQKELAERKEETKHLSEDLAEKVKAFQAVEKKETSRKKLAKDEVRQLHVVHTKLLQDAADEEAELVEDEKRCMREIADLKARVFRAQEAKSDGISKIKALEGDDFDVEDLLLLTAYVDMTTADALRKQWQQGAAKRCDISNAGECAQTSGEEGGVIGGVSAQMESGALGASSPTPRRADSSASIGSNKSNSKTSQDKKGEVKLQMKFQKYPQSAGQDSVAH